MFPIREEHIGKKIAYARSDGRSRLHRSSANSSVKDLTWTVSIIRACNKQDLEETSSKLFVDDGSQWPNPEVIRIHSGMYKVVLIEQQLVLCRRQNITTPALLFRPVLDYFGIDTEAQLVPVLFFGTNQITFIECEDIVKFYPCEDYNSLFQSLQQDPAVDSDFSQWERIQKVQMILLHSPYTLTSCRVQVYGKDIQTWYTAVITKQDVFKKTFQVMDDRTLNKSNVDPKMTQMNFIASDADIDRMMFGEAPRAMPTRMSRTSKDNFTGQDTLNLMGKRPFVSPIRPQTTSRENRGSLPSWMNANMTTAGNPFLAQMGNRNSAQTTDNGDQLGMMGSVMLQDSTGGTQDATQPFPGQSVQNSKQNLPGSYGDAMFPANRLGQSYDGVSGFGAGSLAGNFGMLPNSQAQQPLPSMQTAFQSSDNSSNNLPLFNGKQTNQQFMDGGDMVDGMFPQSRSFDNSMKQVSPNSMDVSLDGHRVMSNRQQPQEFSFSSIMMKSGGMPDFSSMIPPFMLQTGTQSLLSQMQMSDPSGFTAFMTQMQVIRAPGNMNREASFMQLQMRHLTSAPNPLIDMQREMYLERLIQMQRMYMNSMGNMDPPRSIQNPPNMYMSDAASSDIANNQSAIQYHGNNENLDETWPSGNFPGTPGQSQWPMPTGVPSMFNVPDKMKLSQAEQLELRNENRQQVGYPPYPTIRTPGMQITSPTSASVGAATSGPTMSASSVPMSPRVTTPGHTPSPATPSSAAISPAAPNTPQPRPLDQFGRAGQFGNDTGNLSGGSRRQSNVEADALGLFQFPPSSVSLQGPSSMSGPGSQSSNFDSSPFQSPERVRLSKSQDSLDNMNYGNPPASLLPSDIPENFVSPPNRCIQPNSTESHQLHLGSSSDHMQDNKGMSPSSVDDFINDINFPDALSPTFDQIQTGNLFDKEVKDNDHGTAAGSVLPPGVQGFQVRDSTSNATLSDTTRAVNIQAPSQLWINQQGLMGREQLAAGGGLPPVSQLSGNFDLQPRVNEMERNLLTNSLGGYQLGNFDANPNVLSPPSFPMPNFGDLLPGPNFQHGFPDSMMGPPNMAHSTTTKKKRRSRQKSASDEASTPKTSKPRRRKGKKSKTDFDDFQPGSSQDGVAIDFPVGQTIVEPKSRSSINQANLPIQSVIQSVNNQGPPISPVDSVASFSAGEGRKDSNSTVRPEVRAIQPVGVDSSNIATSNASLSLRQLPDNENVSALSSSARENRFPTPSDGFSSEQLISKDRDWREREFEGTKTSGLANTIESFEHRATGSSALHVSTISKNMWAPPQQDVSKGVLCASNPFDDIDFGMRLDSGRGFATEKEHMLSETEPSLPSAYGIDRELHKGSEKGTERSSQVNQELTTSHKESERVSNSGETDRDFQSERIVDGHVSVIQQGTKEPDENRCVPSLKINKDLGKKLIFATENKNVKDLLSKLKHSFKDITPAKLSGPVHTQDESQCSSSHETDSTPREVNQGFDVLSKLDSSAHESTDLVGIESQVGVPRTVDLQEKQQEPNSTQEVPLTDKQERSMGVEDDENSFGSFNLDFMVGSSLKDCETLASFPSFEDSDDQNSNDAVPERDTSLSHNVSSLFEKPISLMSFDNTEKHPVAQNDGRKEFAEGYPHFKDMGFQPSPGTLQPEYLHSSLSVPQVRDFAKPNTEILESNDNSDPSLGTVLQIQGRNVGFSSDQRGVSKDGELTRVYLSDGSKEVETSKLLKPLAPSYNEPSSYSGTRELSDFVAGKPFMQGEAGLRRDAVGKDERMTLNVGEKYPSELKNKLPEVALSLLTPQLPNFSQFTPLVKDSTEFLSRDDGSHKKEKKKTKKKNPSEPGKVKKKLKAKEKKGEKTDVKLSPEINRVEVLETIPEVKGNQDTHKDLLTTVGDTSSLEVTTGDSTPSKPLFGGINNKGKDMQHFEEQALKAGISCGLNDSQRSALYTSASKKHGVGSKGHGDSGSHKKTSHTKSKKKDASSKLWKFAGVPCNENTEFGLELSNKSVKSPEVKSPEFEFQIEFNTENAAVKEIPLKAVIKKRDRPPSLPTSKPSEAKPGLTSSASNISSTDQYVVSSQPETNISSKESVSIASVESAAFAVVNKSEEQTEMIDQSDLTRWYADDAIKSFQRILPSMEEGFSSHDQTQDDMIEDLGIMLRSKRICMSPPPDAHCAKKGKRIRPLPLSPTTVQFVSDETVETRVQQSGPQMKEFDSHVDKKGEGKTGTVVETCPEEQLNNPRQEVNREPVQQSGAVAETFSSGGTELLMDTTSAQGQLLSSVPAGAEITEMPPNKQKVTPLLSKQAQMVEVIKEPATQRKGVGTNIKEGIGIIHKHSAEPGLLYRSMESSYSKESLSSRPLQLSTVITASSGVVGDSQPPSSHERAAHCSITNSSFQGSEHSKSVGAVGSPAGAVAVSVPGLGTTESSLPKDKAAAPKKTRKRRTNKKIGKQDQPSTLLSLSDTEIKMNPADQNVVLSSVMTYNSTVVTKAPLEAAIPSQLKTVVTGSKSGSVAVDLAQSAVAPLLSTRLSIETRPTEPSAIAKAADSTTLAPKLLSKSSIRTLIPEETKQTGTPLPQSMFTVSVTSSTSTLKVPEKYDRKTPNAEDNAHAEKPSPKLPTTGLSGSRDGKQVRKKIGNGPYVVKVPVADLALRVGAFLPRDFVPRVLTKEDFNNFKRLNNIPLSSDSKSSPLMSVVVQSSNTKASHLSKEENSGLADHDKGIESLKKDIPVDISSEMCDVLPKLTYSRDSQQALPVNSNREHSDTTKEPVASGVDKDPETSSGLEEPVPTEVSNKSAAAVVTKELEDTCATEEPAVTDRTKESDASDESKESVAFSTPVSEFPVTDQTEPPAQQKNRKRKSRVRKNPFAKKRKKVYVNPVPPATSVLEDGKLDSATLSKGAEVTVASVNGTVSSEQKSTEDTTGNLDEKAGDENINDAISSEVGAKGDSTVKETTDGELALSTALGRDEHKPESLKVESSSSIGVNQEVKEFQESELGHDLLARDSIESSAESGSSIAGSASDTAVPPSRSQPIPGRRKGGKRRKRKFWFPTGSSQERSSSDASEAPTDSQEGQELDPDAVGVLSKELVIAAVSNLTTDLDSAEIPPNDDSKDDVKGEQESNKHGAVSVDHLQDSSDGYQQVAPGQAVAQPMYSKKKRKGSRRGKKRARIPAKANDSGNSLLSQGGEGSTPTVKERTPSTKNREYSALSAASRELGLLGLTSIPDFETDSVGVRTRHKVLEERRAQSEITERTHGKSPVKEQSSIPNQKQQSPRKSRSRKSSQSLDDGAALEGVASAKPTSSSAKQLEKFYVTRTTRSKAAELLLEMPLVVESLKAPANTARGDDAEAETKKNKRVGKQTSRTSTSSVTSDPGEPTKTESPTKKTPKSGKGRRSSKSRKRNSSRQRKSGTEEKQDTGSSLVTGPERPFAFKTEEVTSEEYIAKKRRLDELLYSTVDYEDDELNAPTVSDACFDIGNAGGGICDVLSEEAIKKDSLDADCVESGPSAQHEGLSEPAVNTEHNQVIKTEPVITSKSPTDNANIPDKSQDLVFFSGAEYADVNARDIKKKPVRKFNIDMICSELGARMTGSKSDGAPNGNPIFDDSDPSEQQKEEMENTVDDIGEKASTSSVDDVQRLEGDKKEKEIVAASQDNPEKAVAFFGNDHSSYTASAKSRGQAPDVKKDRKKAAKKRRSTSSPVFDDDNSAFTFGKGDANGDSLKRNPPRRKCSNVSYVQYLDSSSDEWEENVEENIVHKGKKVKKANDVDTVWSPSVKRKLSESGTAVPSAKVEKHVVPHRPTPCGKSRVAPKPLPSGILPYQQHLSASGHAISPSVSDSRSTRDDVQDTSKLPQQALLDSAAKAKVQKPPTKIRIVYNKGTREIGHQEAINLGLRILKGKGLLKNNSTAEIIFEEKSPGDPALFGGPGAAKTRVVKTVTISNISSLANTGLDASRFNAKITVSKGKAPGSTAECPVGSTEKQDKTVAVSKDPALKRNLSSNSSPKCNLVTKLDGSSVSGPQFVPKIQAPKPSFVEDPNRILQSASKGTVAATATTDKVMAALHQILPTTSTGVLPKNVLPSSSFTVTSNEQSTSTVTALKRSVSSSPHPTNVLVLTTQSQSSVLPQKITSSVTRTKRAPVTVLPRKNQEKITELKKQDVSQSVSKALSPSNVSMPTSVVVTKSNIAGSVTKLPATTSCNTAVSEANTLLVDSVVEPAMATTDSLCNKKLYRKMNFKSELSLIKTEEDKALSHPQLSSTTDSSGIKELQDARNKGELPISCEHDTSVTSVTASITMSGKTMKPQVSKVSTVVVSASHGGSAATASTEAIITSRTSSNTCITVRSMSSVVRTFTQPGSTFSRSAGEHKKDERVPDGSVASSDASDSKMSNSKCTLSMASIHSSSTATTASDTVGMRTAKDNGHVKTSFSEVKSPTSHSPAPQAPICCNVAHKEKVKVNPSLVVSTSDESTLGSTVVSTSCAASNTKTALLPNKLQSTLILPPKTESIVDSCSKVDTRPEHGADKTSHEGSGDTCIIPTSSHHVGKSEAGIEGKEEVGDKELSSSNVVTSAVSVVRTKTSDSSRKKSLAVTALWEHINRSSTDCTSKVDASNTDLLKPPSFGTDTFSKQEVTRSVEQRKVACSERTQSLIAAYSSGIKGDDSRPDTQNSVKRHAVPDVVVAKSIARSVDTSAKTSLLHAESSSMPKLSVSDSANRVNEAALIKDIQQKDGRAVISSVVSSNVSEQDVPGTSSVIIQEKSTTESSLKQMWSSIDSSRRAQTITSARIAVPQASATDPSSYKLEEVTVQDSKPRIEQSNKSFSENCRSKKDAFDSLQMPGESSFTSSQSKPSIVVMSGEKNSDTVDVTVKTASLQVSPKTAGHGHDYSNMHNHLSIKSTCGRIGPTTNLSDGSETSAIGRKAITGTAEESTKLEVPTTVSSVGQTLSVPNTSTHGRDCVSSTVEAPVITNDVSFKMQVSPSHVKTEAPFSRSYKVAMRPTPASGKGQVPAQSVAGNTKGTNGEATSSETAYPETQSELTATAASSVNQSPVIQPAYLKLPNVVLLTVSSQTMSSLSSSVLSGSAARQLTVLSSSHLPGISDKPGTLASPSIMTSGKKDGPTPTFALKTSNSLGNVSTDSTSGKPKQLISDSPTLVVLAKTTQSISGSPSSILVAKLQQPGSSTIVLPATTKHSESSTSVLQDKKILSNSTETKLTKASVTVSKSSVPFLSSKKSTFTSSQVSRKELLSSKVVRKEGHQANERSKVVSASGNSETLVAASTTAKETYTSVRASQLISADLKDIFHQSSIEALPVPTSIVNKSSEQKSKYEESSLRQKEQEIEKGPLSGSDSSNISLSRPSSPSSYATDDSEQTGDGIDTDLKDFAFEMPSPVEGKMSDVKLDSIDGHCSTEELSKQKVETTSLLKEKQKRKTLTLAQELAMKRTLGSVPSDVRDQKKITGTKTQLIRKRGPRKQNLKFEYFLQEGSCKATPKLPRCRDCRNPDHDVNFCRFSLFRRLRRNLRTGKVDAAGFCSPNQAIEEDMKPWKASKDVTFDFQMCKYIVENVGGQFCEVVEEEYKAVTWGSKDGAVAWKRAVGGVREMCDACATTIFNIHWVCEKCGFGVCLDCYRMKLEDKRKPESIDGTKKTEVFRWVSCAPGLGHKPESLTVTQIIPLSELWDLCKDLVKTADELGIKFSLPEKPYYETFFAKSEEPEVSASDSPASEAGEKDGLSGNLTACVKIEETEVTHQLHDQMNGTPPSLVKSESIENCEGQKSKDSQTPSITAKSSENENNDHKELVNKAQNVIATIEKWRCEFKSNDGNLENKGDPSTARSAQKTESNLEENESSDIVKSTEKSDTAKRLLSNLDILAMIASDIDTKMKTTENSCADKIDPARATVGESSDSTASTTDLPRTSSDSANSATDLSRPSSDSAGCTNDRSRPLSNLAVCANDEPRPSSDSADCTTDRPRSLTDSSSCTSDGPQHSSESTNSSDICDFICDGKMIRLKYPNHAGNHDLFQKNWISGKPVLVSNVDKLLHGDIWKPDSFANEFGEEISDVVNCRTHQVIENFSVSEFWIGFESVKDRPIDNLDRPMLLKLKDWPPGADFSDKLPTRFADLMDALPVPEYTRRDGIWNLVSRLPKFFVKPDLGPKMYNAYGSAAVPSAGTTNLHLDMSDAVNVMVYVGIPKEEEARVKETIDTLKTVDQACDEATRKRVRNNIDVPGALWHIYAAEDANKIREFLRKVQAERRKTKISPFSDPIHDQCFYLDHDLRKRLKEEYDVTGYSICQCLGDAVFIPAGAPHQVLNLHSCVKVAEDFVSPEHVGHCFKLTQEFRYLSDKHTNHEDKLQVKNIIFHAVKDSVAVMRNQLHQQREKELERLQTKC